MNNVKIEKPSMHAASNTPKNMNNKIHSDFNGFDALILKSNIRL